MLLLSECPAACDIYTLTVMSRHCAFYVPAHRAMISEETEEVPDPSSSSTLAAPGVNVLPYVLLPLAGPEEFDLDVSRCNQKFVHMVSSLRE